ncbi:MAG: hypothetical protein GY870_00650, partial [archaeon]|nr:hypothetical protein [archaeon]
MAGIGSRLRPFTYSKPKAFLKVAGKRVIDHILDSFEEASEKSLDLLIITGYQNRTIKDYLKQKYENDFNITFKIQEPKGYVGDIPFFGGLGQAIYLSRDWYTEQIKSYESTAPEDYAFIFLSDMIPIDGFAGVFNALCGKDEDNPQKENLADEFKDDDERFKNHQINSQNIKKTPSDIKDVDGIIGVMHVSKEDASNYGIIETDKKTGYIKKLVEKPENFISNQAIAGVYAFKPKAMKRLYEHLEKDVKNFENKKGEVQITPSIQGLV